MLLAVSVAVVVVGMALCLVGFPEFRSRWWYIAGDNWFPVLQARFVYFGATGVVFQGNVATSALPGLAILYAPAVALGDHLRLVQGLPYPVPRPTLWLVVGPEAFAIASFLVWGVDALATQIGVLRSRRRVIALMLAFFVVIPTVQIAGHPEDCAALGLLCYALAAHLRGDHHKVGWWLAAAALMQTWIVLLCPLLLFATPYGRRFGMAARALLIPGVVFLLCLVGAPSDTWRQVVSEQPMVTSGQHTPWYAIAPRLTQYQRVAGAPSRRWGTLVAVLLGLVGLRRPSPRMLLVVASAILLLRPFFETSDWGYFSMPGLVLAGVLAATTTRRHWWWVFIVAVVALSAPTYGYLYAAPQLNSWLFILLLAIVDGAVLAASVVLSRVRAPSPHQTGWPSMSARLRLPDRGRSTRPTTVRRPGALWLERPIRRLRPSLL
jgi:hypothetical protein